MVGRSSKVKEVLRYFEVKLVVELQSRVGEVVLLSLISLR